MELFYKVTAGSLAEVVAENSTMMEETLGCVLLPDDRRPLHAVLYASETQTVGSDDLEVQLECFDTCVCLQDPWL